MDQMRQWLHETLPEQVNFDIWWRADLDRRLEGEWDILRAYGLTDSQQSSDELFSAMIAGQHVSTDPINHPGDVALRKTALRKFLRTQYGRDANIRFREADLPNQPLLQSYLDIQVGLNSLVSHRDKGSEASRNVRVLLQDGNRVHGSGTAAVQSTAAGLLLNYGRTAELRNVIVEGAPGQGNQRSRSIFARSTAPVCLAGIQI